MRERAATAPKISILLGLFGCDVPEQLVGRIDRHRPRYRERAIPFFERRHETLVVGWLFVSTVAGPGSHVRRSRRVHRDKSRGSPRGYHGVGRSRGDHRSRRARSVEGLTAPRYEC